MKREIKLKGWGDLPMGEKESNSYKILQELEQKQLIRSIGLRYVISNALRKHEHEYGYREDINYKLTEEVFEAVEKYNNK